LSASSKRWIICSAAPSMLFASSVILCNNNCYRLIWQIN
jgi:hypothetical protein